MAVYVGLSLLGVSAKTTKPEIALSHTELLACSRTYKRYAGR